LLKIVEKIADSPVRMLVKPGVKFFPGFIVKLVDYGQDVVCDLCDGPGAVGVAGSRCYVKTDGVSFDPKLMLKVWPQRMVFRTDRYEEEGFPEEGGHPLYVSQRGLLTGVKPERGLCVARLISPPDADRTYLEALWL
jgi:hypothetical protein